MGRTGVTYVMVEVRVLCGGRISTGFVRVLEYESGVGWLIVLGARWVLGLVLCFGRIHGWSEFTLISVGFSSLFELSKNKLATVAEMWSLG